MGRAKRKMEVTSNERRRRLAFEGRKKGLLKKAYELSTLCDIGMCVIIYSPKQDIDDPMGMEVETWPTNHNEVHDIIESYKKRSNQDDSDKTVDLPSFFQARKKKLEEELMKLRAKNAKKENEEFDALPEEDLRELDRVLESKIEAVNTRLQFTKATNQPVQVPVPVPVPVPVQVPVPVPVLVPAGNMVDCTQKQCSYSMQNLFGRNSCMQWEVIDHQQSIYDFDVPLQYYYPLDQTQNGGGGLIPVDNYSNSIANPMILNHSYCTDQLGGASSSNVVYTPMDGAIDVDPVAGGWMLDNNNPASFDSEMWHQYGFSSSGYTTNTSMVGYSEQVHHA